MRACLGAGNPSALNSERACFCVLTTSSVMQSAIDADPKNPLAKFEKAAVLMSQEQYQPALLELEALKVSSHYCSCLLAYLIYISALL